MSKSTPRGAVAKFAAAGKQAAKKDLALIAMSYGTVYVARVAMGASDVHTLNAFREAEAFDGPSLILAYSHCIAHGYDMAHGMEQQKLAVQSGYWPLLRYNPALLREGKNPLTLDSKAAVAAPEASTSTTRAATPCLSRAAPERRASCCGWRSKTYATAGTCTRSWRRRRRASRWSCP